MCFLAIVGCLKLQATSDRAHKHNNMVVVISPRVFLLKLPQHENVMMKSILVTFNNCITHSVICVNLDFKICKNQVRCLNSPRLKHHEVNEGIVQSYEYHSAMHGLPSAAQRQLHNIVCRLGSRTLVSRALVGGLG